jgi:DNA-binding NarL/FixJ family response regulator
LGGAMKVRVMIVDDHRMFREALRYQLQRVRGLEVVAEAASGAEALQQAAETDVDLVCMDVHMRGMNGIEATRRLVALQPGVKIIALSAYSEKEFVIEMREAGAVGYVTKGEAGDELVKAIRAAVRGHAYYSPEITAAMADMPAKAAADGPYSPAQFSVREEEILRLLREGCSASEIARRLSLDKYLVDVYQRNIVRKLGLSNPAQLTHSAHQ